MGARRKRAGQWPVVAALQDEHARALRAPPAGGGPLWRWLVPARPGGAHGVARRPHGPGHPPPEQERQAYHEPSGFEACRLLAEAPMDHHRGLEEALVLRRPMVRFVDGEQVPGPRGEVTRRGPRGAQPEAARLVLPAPAARGIGLQGSLQPITQSGDRARRVGARPAPAISGPFLPRDVPQMGGGTHGAAVRRRRCGIGTAALEH